MVMELNNRRYAKLSELSPQSLVRVDGGFACMEKGVKEVFQDTVDGPLYVACDRGQHVLDGQLTKGGYLIGIYRA